MRKIHGSILLVIGAMALSACGKSVDQTPEEMFQSGDEAMVETEEPTADPVVYDASRMPNWFSVSVNDVN
jgi:hypothetical protein